MADFILNMPLRFFARVFGNPAGDPVLLKSRGVTLLRDICRISCLPNGTFPLKQTCKEMKGREVCCTKWITAYKQIYLYSIPPSNISTTVDIICIFLHVNVNVIVSFYNSVRQVNANVSSSTGNGVSKLL